MNRQKYMIGEIARWREEALITPEQAETLTQRYKTETKTNPLIFVFSTVGAVMVVAGLILILATGWQSIPTTVRRAISFLPLLIAQGLAVRTLVKGKTSLAWREGLSLFYTAAIFGTLKLVELSFNVPTDYSRYILLCGVMTAPVFLIFRSVTACAGYLFAVINWGAIYADIGDYGAFGAYSRFAVTVALAVFGVFMLRRSAKDAPPLLKTVVVWLSAVVFFAVAIIFVRMTDSYLPPILLLMFNVLLLSGKQSDDWTSPVVTAGTAGTFVMMFLIGVGLFKFDADDRNAMTFILCAGLIVSLVVLAALNAKRDLRRIIITAADILICAIFLFGLARATEARVSDLFFLPMALIVFICGIVYLADGIREAKLTDINIGLIAVFAVLGSWLSQSEIGIFTKGVGFFLIGCAFLALNVILLKKYRNKRTATEAQSDEIQ